MLELVAVALFGALLSHGAAGLLGAVVASSARRAPPLAVAAVSAGRRRPAAALALMKRGGRFLLGLVLGYVLPHGHRAVAKLVTEKLRFTLI